MYNKARMYVYVIYTRNHSASSSELAVIRFRIDREDIINVITRKWEDCANLI
jgi:hypothetical protein